MSGVCELPLAPDPHAVLLVVEVQRLLPLLRPVLHGADVLQPTFEDDVLELEVERGHQVVPRGTLLRRHVLHHRQVVRSHIEELATLLGRFRPLRSLLLNSALPLACCHEVRVATQMTHKWLKINAYLFINAIYFESLN